MSPLIQSYMSSGNQGHTFFPQPDCVTFPFCWTQWKVAKTASASSRSSQNLLKKVLTRHLYFIISGLPVPLLIDTMLYPVKSISSFWPAHSTNPCEILQIVILAKTTVNSASAQAAFIVAPLFRILHYKNEAMLQLGCLWRQTKDTI